MKRDSKHTCEDEPPALPTHEVAAEKTFKTVERALLIVAALMTLGAASIEVWSAYQRGSINLADILLMFLYTEVIGMIAVFYSGRGSFFVLPIFIAITALARLIVLQGKDMAPEMSSMKPLRFCCCLLPPS